MDAEQVGVSSQEADGPFAVMDVGRKAEFGGKAVIDRGHGESELKEHAGVARLKSAGLVSLMPSAAVDEDGQGDSLSGAEDGPGEVQLERDRSGEAVDDISLGLERGRGSRGVGRKGAGNAPPAQRPFLRDGIQRDRDAEQNQTDDAEDCFECHRRFAST